MATANYYFLTLDIETSKEMVYDEKLGKDIPIKTWLAYGVTKLFNIKGVEIKKKRFRTWTQLIDFYNYLSTSFRNKKILCFVHNLSFEFDFIIKNIGKPRKFICNSSHSVIMGEIKGLRIEFRCTYQLSHLPLSKLGEIYGLPKGDCDYRTIYPDDDVRDDEWKYCERDNDIIPPYIIDLLKQYKLLSNIPYTSTGMVRNDLKMIINNDDIVGWDYMPPENCYDALLKTFRGGLTMSNPRFTNILINSKIRCFDEKSKYPSIMITEEFPYTIEKMEVFKQDEYKKYKFWIAKIRITNLISKYDWGFISYSTNTFTDFNDCDFFNGKLINCHNCEMYITNIDLDSIKLVYYYDSIEFLEFYPMKKYSKLPKHFYDLICKYAKPKYELGKKLKEISNIYGEESEEYKECYRDYMRSKEKLNGIYGQMVQKLIQSDYDIDDNFNWIEIIKDYVYTENKHLKRNFIYGIMITSYSRRDLIKNIVHNCPWNFVYCDTDSIKYIDIGNEFKDLNSYIDESVRDLPYLKDFNRFEEEEPYTQFITYGAKKYAYIKNGIFHFTVAGLPKKTIINGFDDFKLGKTYKNCKLAKRYIYHKHVTDVDESTDTIINEYDVDEDYGNGGVALFEVDYTLEMTKVDLEYIKQRSKIWQKRNIQQNIFCPN